MSPELHLMILVPPETENYEVRLAFGLNPSSFVRLDVRARFVVQSDSDLHFVRHELGPPPPPEGLLGFGGVAIVVFFLGCDDPCGPGDDADIARRCLGDPGPGLGGGPARSTRLPVLERSGRGSC